MSYNLPNGEIVFTSGEILTSEKMNKFSGNQADIADFLDDIESHVSVNNAALTIKKNGTTVQTFTANSSVNKVANITVPTTVAELSDESNYARASAIPNVYDATLTLTSGGSTLGTFTSNQATNKTINVPVPTKTSDLTNDSDYVTDSNYIHIDNNYSNNDKSAVTRLNQALDVSLAVASDSSTTTITENKVNIYTGTSTTNSVSIPVASASQAGVINALTYQAIQSNSDNINAILNGSVSIANISANPSQSDLTTAWTTATGLSTVINGAKINDSTNQKVWTYYTNTSTWYAATNTTQVVVNDATNTSKGIVKGSASGDGTIYVESDATMSVNGWDDLVDDVSNNTSDIAALDNGKVDKESGKGLSTNDFTTAEKTKLAGIPTVNDATLTIKQNGTTVGTFTANSSTNTTANITVPTVNNATLTIQQNGTTVGTFSANASTNATANITTPTITYTTTDPGEGGALSADNFIVVYEA